MLFKSFSVTGAFLFLTTRVTLAKEIGCYGSEKFTDLKKDGDLNDTMEVFCNKKIGTSEFIPGQVVDQCYDINTVHSVYIKIDFGNYPNSPSKMTMSPVACRAVLNYVKQQCTLSGGNLLVSYVGGSLSHTLGASSRRNEKEQAVDEENQVSAVDDIEGDDQENENKQNVVYGVQDLATSTTVSITTMTGTIQPPPGCPTVTVTSISVSISTLGRQKHKATKTITVTLTTTATASSTETITVSASTSSSLTSPTSSSSSTINTDNDFYGWVRVDPQAAKC